MANEIVICEKAGLCACIGDCLHNNPHEKMGICGSPLCSDWQGEVACIPFTPKSLPIVKEL